MNNPNTTQASEIMHKNVLSVYEGWSIQRLADFFMKHKISGAPVIALRPRIGRCCQCLGYFPF